MSYTFSWKKQLGNPKDFNASKPKWNNGDSERALDRKRLRQASNTIAFLPGEFFKQTCVGHPIPPASPEFCNISAVTPLDNGEFCNQLPSLCTILQASTLKTLTPFRAMMNSGDPAGTINKPIRVPESLAAKITAQLARDRGYNNSSKIYFNKINQVSSSKRASNAGWKNLAGSVKTDPTEGSVWCGNPKYVYDGSDYVRFKKLQAQNRNYNDPTFGGDQHSSAQVALSRVRH